MVKKYSALMFVGITKEDAGAIFKKKIIKPLTVRASKVFIFSTKDPISSKQ